MKYFNSYQAAEIMNVNVSTIKRWTDTKKLDCTQTEGGHRKFTLYNINEFLKKNNKSKQINIYKISDSLNDILCKHIENIDYEKLKNYFLDILLSGDTERITAIIEGLYLKSAPIYQIYDKLVSPSLNRVGQLWLKNNISIADEHLASNTIIKVINNLSTLLYIEENNSKKIILLFCLKHNNHSIPLQMADQIFSVNGHKVINCSSNTPVFSLKNIIKTYKPNIILASLTYVEDKNMAISEIVELKKIINENNKSDVYIAGISENYFEDEKFSGIEFLNSMSDVNRIAKQ